MVMSSPLSKCCKRRSYLTCIQSSIVLGGGRVDRRDGLDSGEAMGNILIFDEPIEVGVPVCPAGIRAEPTIAGVVSRADDVPKCMIVVCSSVPAIRTLFSKNCQSIGVVNTILEAQIMQ